MQQAEEAALAARGLGAKAPLYQTVIAADTHPAPAIFGEVAPSAVAVASVARSDYTDPAFAAREREALWARIWYMAGRVEEVPEAGDFLVYEGPVASILVTRDDDGALNAFVNSCPHRGMKLCQGEGTVARITCPFHAMRWTLDGKLDHIPARRDFPEIEGDELPLARLRIAEWQGFIFVCHDPAAPELTDYLGRIVTDFAGWDHGQRYAARKLTKVVHANWKACIETFIEAYHLVGIHPQALPFGGDSSAQYDVWPDQPHMSRMLQPVGVPSDQHAGTLSEQQVLEAAVRLIMGPAAPVPALPEGTTARAHLSAMLRADPSLPALSDTELLDALQYSVFPNVVLFRSLLYPYAYRFTPDRQDPNRSTYDFYMFEPLPAEGPPPPVETIALGDQDSYAATGAFPAWLGQIYDQDSAGLAQLQAGLREGDGVIRFARYQESRLRQLHKVLQVYLAGERP